jgi:hypothetical protein
MPERLHYKNNRRIADVIISALEGVGFIYVGKEPIQVNHNGRLTSIVLSKEHKRKLMLAAADKATHGYDKTYMSMKGVFFAKGSMFKRNYSSEGLVENVDVHPLLCNILAIECESRNGTFDKIKRFLRYEHRILTYESDRQKYELFNNRGSIGAMSSACFKLISFFVFLCHFSSIYLYV